MSDELTLVTRTGLPEAWQVLLAEFARDDWRAHPNFGGMVEFWLQRHLMFRQLLDRLERDAQAHIAGHISFQDYAPRLSHYGGTLLNELHGHHNIEDHHYFPKLSRLDPRLEGAFALLDRDHHAMDGLLHDLAQTANAVLQGGEAGMFADRLAGFGRLLDRHLVDEEEIIVPVILKTGFKG